LIFITAGQRPADKTNAHFLPERQDFILFHQQTLTGFQTLLGLSPWTINLQTITEIQYGILESLNL
jgi:hypothetical protein